MDYSFYGWREADVTPVTEAYAKVNDPRVMYDILSCIWSADTCAPRMRQKWSQTNKTLGQCSITAFLVQDVFGGKVYGIPLPEGGFHCYNVVRGRIFDLTSEQFGDEKLSYENNPEQLREVHFASDEKKLRYDALKDAFDDAVSRR